MVFRLHGHLHACMLGKVTRRALPLRSGTCEDDCQKTNDTAILYHLSMS